jgi:hypothetical protein
MVMAAKLTRLTHKTAIQLNLVAEGRTICSSRCRWPVRKLLDTPSYKGQGTLHLGVCGPEGTVYLVFCSYLTVLPFHTSPVAGYVTNQPTNRQTDRLHAAESFPKR